MKKLSTMLLVILSIVLAFGASASASTATGVIQVYGNDKDVPGTEGLIAVTFEGAKSGTFTKEIPELGMSIMVTFSDDGKIVSWNSTKNAKTFKVFVKGGPGGNLYTYSYCTNGDTGLEAPINRGGNVPEISHVTIYVKKCTCCSI